MKSEELLYLRGTIDDLDRLLVQTLASRFRVSERIGQIKGQYNMHIRDTQREKEHITQVRKNACECQLEPDVAENIIKLIMAEATERHKKWQKKQI